MRRRAPTPRGTGDGERRRSAELVLTVPLVAAGIALLLGNATVRGAEAVVTSGILHLLTGTVSRALPANQLFMWDLGGSDSYGLLITADCSSAFMIGPALAFAGLLSATRRFSSRRVLVASALVSGVLFLANIARLLVIALATMAWGPKTGYGWTHAIGGSMVTIAGAVTALAILLFILFGSGRATAGTPGS